MPDLKVRMDSPIDKDGLKKQLQANHFYFIMDEEMKKYRPVKESESWVYDSALYFQEMFDSVKNRVIDHKNKKTDAEGLFWGYKMYPSLGYQPDDWESYPKLKEFYKYCADEGIPITSHCSSGGMAIADPFIYFKEAIKKQAALDLARQRTVAARLREKDEFIFNIQKPGLDKEGFALMTSDIADNEAFDENFLEYLMKSYAYVSESCLHPANWENVLMRYPKLKLNLAHFTGKETILDYFFKTGVMDQLANTVQGENKGWIKKLLEMIDSGKYPNLYTDLAYFDLHRYRGSDDGREIDGTRELTEVFGRNDFDLFVEAMVKLLGSHPALKRHILFGSDWLMVEMSYKSVGLYCMNLCEALRQVSLKVGYDVWYQFTVLNNLRFLGILDDNDRLFEDKLLQYAKNFGAALSHIAADSNPKKGSIEVIQGLDTKTSSERFSFLYDKIACRTGSKFTADFSFTPGAKREGLERTFMPVDSSSFTMYGKKRCEL